MTPPRDAAMKVDELLAAARTLGLDRLDATVILSHHLAQPRAWLLAHGDAPVPVRLASACGDDYRRRADGVPLAYLTGEREFFGLTLEVSSAVLVPRPETELLVEWALELLATELADREHPLVADLGTGSGAIALAMASRCPRARVHAVDASEGALQVARRNAARLGLPVQCHHGDWWQPLSQPIDLALANPPYVAAGDPHLQALRHEPAEALVGGADGLAQIRRLVAGAPSRVAGWLLIEHGWDQAAAVAGLLAAAGARRIETRRDLSGHPRCTGGRW